MRIVSVSENLKIEKRVAITLDIAKKYIALGFEVSLSENYAEHLGTKDDEYTKVGVIISKNETLVGLEIVFSNQKLTFKNWKKSGTRSKVGFIYTFWFSLSSTFSTLE